MPDNPFDDDSAEPMRRFARRAREGGGLPDPMLCRNLRARQPHLPESPAVSGPSGTSAAAWWCLRTMRPAGPDGALALPEDCTDERICFEPAVGREVET